MEVDKRLLLSWTCYSKVEDTPHMAGSQILPVSGWAEMVEVKP